MTPARGSGDRPVAVRGRYRAHRAQNLDFSVFDLLFPTLFIYIQATENADFSCFSQLSIAISTPPKLIFFKNIILSE